MNMDLGLVGELIGANGGLGVVCATRADGSVHASLVNAGIIDATGPAMAGPVVATVVRSSATKLALWRQRPQATITFTHGWKWVSVEGTVEVFGPDDRSHPDLPGLLRTVFVAAGGSHDDWATYDRVMAEERRAVVAINPIRTLTNR